MTTQELTVVSTAEQKVMKPLRILWASNAPWAASGYGVQTALFLPRLKAAGHPMGCVAWYGLQGAPIDMDGIIYYPCVKDAYGNDMMAGYAHHFNADIVMPLIDAWVQHPAVINQFRYVPYFPVDHDPLPPGVEMIVRQAYERVVYSKFALAKLAEVGLKAEYVPHAVDTKLYDIRDKAVARKAVGAPEDKFIIGLFAANKGNPSRKAFDQQIEAFAIFQKGHPDAILYLHTDFEGFQGESIDRLLMLNNIAPEMIGRVPQFEYRAGLISNDQLCNAYNSCDVLLHATRGEGFGVHIIEAGACGVPAIVTDFSAMPEIVDAIGGGWKVPFVSKQFTAQNSYQVTPSVAGIVDALEAAYAERDNQELRQRVRAGTVAAYDADRVVQDYWLPVLDRIAGRIEDDTKKADTRKAKREAARAKFNGNGAEA